MANSVGFSVYKVTVNNKNQREYWEMYYGYPSHDGFTLITEILKSIKNQLIRVDDEKNEDGEYIDNRAAKIINLTKDVDSRTIEGVMLKGEAGHIKEVYNLETLSEEPEYTIGKDQADLMPLFFRFYIPDGMKHGILMLQTYGIQGIKSYITEILNSRASDHTIKITQLMDEKVLKQFAKQGKMQDVYLVNSGKSTSSIEALRNTRIAHSTLDSEDKLELKMHRKKGHSAAVLHKIINCIRNKEKLQEEIETPMRNYDDVLIEIKQGGKKQKFSLLNPDDSPIRYDVTSKIIIGYNGYPTLESLKLSAEYVWESIQSILGIEV
ncbi:MAG: hypothetical protein CMJ19_22850 [Phycisphaeraceae bacterium]|nr:hypothetical protein [Phycisphaeraceae bacterium]